MRIELGDFENPQVIALLQDHLLGMQETSPPESVYALDLTGLQNPAVTFWTAWEGDALMGCGALKQISRTQAEIKSMRTHHKHLRRGVAASLLEHMLAQAKLRGYSRISLETGSGSAFDAALALYRKYGFVSGPAFGDYEASAFNQFLHLDIS